MVLEIAKPAALLLSILSLTSAFHAAFLAPATSLDERLYNGLLRLALAGAIALVSGLLFREAELPAAHSHTPHHTPEAAAGERLFATLPVQLFCWAAAAMLVLFAVSWYLETYVILYRDSRF